ncbi:MAG: D-2-hydroxyacid dehydrogenase [Gemmatimonadales bacterium]|nr:MAG: D-2-hydroxyacid dehydrogenase [Gemmatimonadales bacterium]
MADVVLDLLDRRPVWAIPEWAVAEIRTALPGGWILYSATSPADGSGDGRGVAPEPAVLDEVQGARVYVGYGVAPEILEAGAGTLEWVHTGAAGVGSSLHDTMRRSGVRFTNSAGIHGPPIAETVLGMLLYFFRGLDLAAEAQRRGVWDPDPFFRADTPVRELSGATVGIIGYGGIGREVGERLRGMGVRVLGLRRSAAAETSPPGVEILRGMGEDGLGVLLDQSDALVITAPETPETRGLLSRERLERLRPGAVIVNVARGSIVDEEALVEGLLDGRIRGAGLDVFQTEPLPPESPLWACPGVLLSPHVSGVSRGFWRREVDLILENMSRWRAGERLRNEVDLDLGY